MNVLLSLILHVITAGSSPTSCVHALPWFGPQESGGVVGSALPVSAQSFLRLGSRLEGRGSMRAAAMAYLAGTRCHGPLAPYCRVALARTLLILGSAAETMWLVQWPSWPRPLAGSVARLGAWVRLEQGRWSEVFRELDGAAPRPAEAQCHEAVLRAMAWLGLSLPDSARAVLWRGLEGDVSGVWGGRACRLLEALSAGEDSLVVRDAVARARQRRGELEPAVAHWKRRARSSTGVEAAEAQLALGNALCTQGRVAEARGVLEEVAREAWNETITCEALWELAQCAGVEGDDEGMAAAHARYARVCPEGSRVADAMWHRARAMERMGRFKEARELFRALNALHPGEREEDCLFREGLCWYLEEVYPSACAVFDSLSVLYPTSRSWYWLGKALERVGHIGGAESCFARAASHDGTPSYYSVRARHRVSLGGSQPGGEMWGLGARESLPRFLQALGDLHHRPSRWAEIRDCLHRADLLLAVGMASEAGAECYHALDISEGEPYVNALAIGLLESARAYPFSMRVALQWWRGGGPDVLLWRWNPPAYRELVGPESAARGVDSALVWALMREESWFDKDAVSRAGAVGLMQLMPSTAAAVARGFDGSGANDLRDPVCNVRLGVAHLSDLMAEFPFVEAALAAYNAGRSAARRWLDLAWVRDRDTFVESITYGETKAYVQRVISTYAVYRAGIGHS